VAREPSTGKAALVNPIVPSTDDERIAFERAAQRQNLKKLKRTSSDGELALKQREQTKSIIGNLLEKAAPLKRMPALADKNSILMYKTALSNALTCQPQGQNIHGRIFGGFLMRRAFELAHATAQLFSGGEIIFLEVDDVTFKRPVNIGDLLQLESVVLYTQQKDERSLAGTDHRPHPEIHVEVVAYVTDPSKLTSHVSNTFNFTFAVRNKEKVLAVYPGTELEAERVVRMMLTDKEQEEHDLATMAS